MAGLLGWLEGDVPHAMYRDEADDSLIVRAVQDVEPLLERNKKLYNDGDGYSPSREFRRAASLPPVLVQKWYQEGINIFDDNHWPLITHLLDAHENRHFRTAPGVLSRRPWRSHFAMRGNWSTRRPLSHGV
jgi:hypothetical protein